MSSFSFPHPHRGVKRQEVACTITIERNGREIEVEVTGTYCPGRPECRYLRNGDPGYPAEPSEIVDLVAKLPDGIEVVLTERETEAATDALFETISE
jgi:hypothetical protein